MTWRYRLVFFCILTAFFLVILRLFYWQVVKAEELSMIGESQYGITLEDVAARGLIKTSDSFPIAANILSFRVVANPKVVNPTTETNEFLAKTLEMDVASISALLRKDRYWISLKDSVDFEVKQKIESKKIDGISFEDSYTRYYPEASMASKLIGFVGKNDKGANQGYFGIEGYYDRQLKGKNGKALYIRDALGRPIVPKTKEDTGRVDGRNVVLNINRAIQFLAEKKLAYAVEKYQASGGMVGILETKTGNIVALASYPNFNSNMFYEFDSNLYINPFISSTYEPGSTFKALVMASAIDAGVVKPDTKCPICDSPLKVYDYTIKTWNNKYYKDTTMIDVIAHSDNTGMVFAAQKLGLDSLYEYLSNFGIGKQTGIDLQGEASVSLRPKDEWYPIDLATASFGQGISITPIQLLTAFNAIANNGVVLEPHVVSKIETPDGNVISVEPKIIGKPIKQTTATVMKEILVNAVEKGDAKWAKPKGYRIAGKTGTAQIPVAGHYDPTKTIASFIGFAPADDPKFTMIVIFDKPTTSIYGSETAAPLFFDIAKDLFLYYKIQPDSSLSSKSE